MNQAKDFSRFTEYYQTFDESEKWYIDKIQARRLAQDLPHMKEVFDSEELRNTSYFLRKKVGVLFNQVVINAEEYKNKIGEEKYNIADKLLIENYTRLIDLENE